MFWKRKKKLPITDADRIWVEDSLNWLRKEQGANRFMKIRTVTPTKDFYDKTFDGTEKDAEYILKLVEKDIGVSIMPRSILTECHLEVQYFELKELKISLDTAVSYRTDIEHELPKAVAEIIKNEIPIIR